VNSLAPEVIEPQLRGRFGQPYVYVETCTSTQRLLDGDAPEGALAVAEEQTAGRGRLGRDWHAPARTSVLASVLLHPPVPPARLPELALVAGEAVARAVAETTGLEPTVKFPNDVLVDGKKVAGILAESSEGRVVLGIGINVNQDASELPPGVNATSLRLDTGATVDRATVLVAVLQHLEQAYERWVSGIGVSC
jgi:BirA family transcriptional regulator, biotin operon repressor / biotin---[acetyl-CoA-carboxylase] ligase